MGLKHIIWDWNGTLLDDIRASFKSINAMLSDYSLPGLSLERYREIFDFPLRPCYEVMGFDVSAQDDWDRVAREFHTHYDSWYSVMDLREGISHLLDHVTAKGIPMSVLSASEQGILERMLGEWNIIDYFSLIRGKSDVYGDSKLGVAKAMISEMATEPDDILLVGDTTHDYEVARDLNCGCVLLTGGHQSEDRLKACGCEVFSSLADLKAHIETLSSLPSS